MADVVDLTFDSDQEEPNCCAQIPARISPLQHARAVKPGRSPHRQPLSPVQHRPVRSISASIREEINYGRGLGGKPASGRLEQGQKSLNALTEAEDVLAAERDETGQLVTELEEHDGSCAALASRPGIRQRRARVLTGLCGAFADDWDKKMAAQIQGTQLGQPAAEVKASEDAPRHGFPEPSSLRASTRRSLPASNAHFADYKHDAAHLSAAAAASAVAEGRDGGNIRPLHSQPSWRPGEEPAFQPTESQDSEWMPDCTGSQAVPVLGPDNSLEAAPKRRRAKRSQQEKESEAAEKARQKAEKLWQKEQRKLEEQRQKACKKQEREYDSETHYLKWLTVVLDPGLIDSSAIGARIVDRLLATQSDGPHEKVAYRVASGVEPCLQPTGLHPYKGIAWLRQVPAPAPGDGSSSGIQGESQGGYQLVNTRLPYVMVCMEAEEFVEEVLRDGLEGLLGLLELRCPGCVAWLTVCGLEGYLTRRERSEAARNLQARSGQVGFVRLPVDEFVVDLAVRCPGVRFRDVVDLAAAGEHVLAVSKAIAREPYKANDATLWLGSHSQKQTQPWRSLLGSHPLPHRPTEVCAEALYKVPVSSLGPGVAHAVAAHCGGLGGLMRALLDPTRSRAEKCRELEYLPRTGSARPMKVGPAAAAVLHRLLTATDADMAINSSD